MRKKLFIEERKTERSTVTLDIKNDDKTFQILSLIIMYILFTKFSGFLDLIQHSNLHLLCSNPKYICMPPTILANLVCIYTYIKIIFQAHVKYSYAARKSDYLICNLQL